MKSEETELQKVLLCYACPECSSSQLITKPRPKAVAGGGVVILTSIVTCANQKCKCQRKVRRYPNGAYKSFKIKTEVI